METNEIGPRTVVVHASNAASDVRKALTAAQRIRDAVEQVQPLVVVNGEAIEGLIDKEISELPEGVKLAACNNAMKAHGLAAKDLPLGTQIVGSGVVYIAQCELAGAHYIRI
ncbi:MAG: hypothetical protein LKI93_05325 [Bifidobacteriaceae bacterium]|jgi:intracellular sulfur oxidation DsrE/DsrF family protein|nr:hypothetical protein [Bifidobacteriaceae bacterium]MCI1914559.1 hypothetical protein [Bifidobacteriaceae bacterium]